MLQDYSLLADDELELIEKQTLRTVVQAVQQYSREARRLFETTRAVTDAEVIVLAEDLVQYALEVAECYPIDLRFAGFIDYKRVRWLSTVYGLIPQALLVDAKASTENNRETLQQSQLNMDAEFPRKDASVVTLAAGVPPHVPVVTQTGSTLNAVTTSVFVHFYYSKTAPRQDRYRELKSIFVIGLPHARLKPKYNPNPTTTFFGQGKHSPAREEAPRIRVYFSRLRSACPWRLQELKYTASSDYAEPTWRDVDPDGAETLERFEFLGR